MQNREHVTLHPDVPGGGCWSLSAHDVVSVCSTWNKIWVLSTSCFVRTFIIYNKIFWLLSVRITSYLFSFDAKYIFAHETTIYLNPHNSSKWGSSITGRFGYKHTFFQNVVSTKEEFFFFRKNAACLSVGLLKIGQVNSVSCKTVCRWVTKNCCFMSIL